MQVNGLERQWKQETIEGRKAQEEYIEKRILDSKTEGEPISIFIQPGSTMGNANEQHLSFCHTK